MDMPSVKVYNISGAEVGEMDLNKEIFDCEYNEPLIHQAVVTILSNQRQGTKSALTRAEVRGGGIKPWRQKGTGRARHGSIRSPIWTGGGIVFAPKPRDFSKKMNIKAKRQALKSALSQKVRTGNFIVLEDIKLQAPKTKEMANILNNLKIEGKVLLITPPDQAVIRASNNLPNVMTSSPQNINTYDVVNCGKILITKEGVDKITEVFA